MTPTLSQLEAMTDDQLNAQVAEALGYYVATMYDSEVCWYCKGEAVEPITWSPATNIADAMGLPMPNVYRVDYTANLITFMSRSSKADFPRTLEGEARARTIFFLLTRGQKP